MAKNKNRLLSTLLPLLFSVQLFAQARSGLENYHQVTKQQSYLWVPIINYTSSRGHYAELRYNYEDINTISIYAGKTFSISKPGFTWELTPMIGYSFGNFKGVSAAFNSEYTHKKIYLSSQMQYSLAVNSNSSNFYFNWTEAGYTISDFFYAGLGFQFTCEDRAADFQPGIVAGFSFGNFSIPFYYFSSGPNDRLFMVGLNFEHDLQPRKKKKTKN